MCISYSGTTRTQKKIILVFTGIVKISFVNREDIFPSRSINTQKKNLANIQPSWPHTWSMTHTSIFIRMNIEFSLCKTFKPTIEFPWIIVCMTFKPRIKKFQPSSNLEFVCLSLNILVISGIWKTCWRAVTNLKTLINW